jgi:hypothetical protein
MKLIVTGTPLLLRPILCLTPGLIAFLVAALVSIWVPPYPNLHDDFSNLLVADTLWHGRVSNPTPPSHELLQTFHVIVEPTYAAKYPIGIGAMLALGKLLFGVWHAGMWIAAGLACSALTWMLLAAVPKRWAWTFGMFAALHPMWQTGWSQEYTHGWLAVAAMALVIGGMLRIRRSRCEFSWHAPLAVAGGLVLGIFSRPFEVALLSSILGVWLAFNLMREKRLMQVSFWRAIAPASILLAVGFGLQGFINRSVTGSWLKLPYQLHEEQYGVAPLFIWQKPHEPTLGHRFEQQAEFHRGWSLDSYSNAASWPGYASLMGNRVWQMMKFWGWILVTIPFAIVAIPRQRRRYGMILAAALLALAIINGIPWFFHTYVSTLIPVAILLCAVVVQAGLKNLSHRNGETRSENLRRQRWMMIGLLAMQTLGLVMASRSMVLSATQDPDSPNQWFTKRATAEADLLNRDGNHLAIVRYANGHDVHHEWVFNGADPVQARIVWARWDESLIKRLLIDYPDRSVWIVEVSNDDSYRFLTYQSKDPPE